MGWEFTYSRSGNTNLWATEKMNYFLDANSCIGSRRTWKAYMTLTTDESRTNTKQNKRIYLYIWQNKVYFFRAYIVYFTNVTSKKHIQMWSPYPRWELRLHLHKKDAKISLGKSLMTRLRWTLVVELLVPVYSWTEAADQFEVMLTNWGILGAYTRFIAPLQRVNKLYCVFNRVSTLDYCCVKSLWFVGVDALGELFIVF